MAIETVESRNLYSTEIYSQTFTTVGADKPCLYPQTTMTKQLIGTVYREAYVPESRPFPVDLLSAMTSRALIKRYVTYASREKRTFKANNKVCSTSYYSNYLVGMPPGSSAPSTGWETRSRLQVSEQALNLAQSVFEYRQTCDMFATAARLADELYEENVTKNKRYRRRLTVANVAQAKLYASFGLVPALSDLQGALDIMNARFNSSAVLVRHFSGLSKGKNRGVYDYTGPVSWSWDRSQRWSLFVGYSTDPRRMTMGNPASLAWELVPWSWLVDGLVDVGSYLQSLDALQGVQWLKGTLTTKDRLTSVNNSTAALNSELVRPGRHREFRYSRGVLSSIPLDRPRWVASSSWSKVVNGAAALIAQRSSPKYVQFDWKNYAPKSVQRQLRSFFRQFRS